VLHRGAAAAADAVTAASRVTVCDAGAEAHPRRRCAAGMSWSQTRSCAPTSPDAGTMCSSGWGRLRRPPTCSMTGG